MQTIRDLRIGTKCRSCTNKCCSQPYDWVYLTDAEVDAIQDASQRPASEFIVERTNHDVGATFRILNLPCQFLDQESGECTIYESRPLLCRLFPFYLDPLTGQATLLPAQCGSNLIFHPSQSTHGWQLTEYERVGQSWVRDLWRDAMRRYDPYRNRESNTRAEGSP